ncbi:hypothetical protein BGZ63DRAFT_406971 [Mariannaea sp. PMI_226]|nr:hypothetical protein BGZ63DRAFT_406971 [Mariannaea sp. PMI_226]
MDQNPVPDDPRVDPDVDTGLDDDQALMAQAMGFSSFGAQHPNKKRRYNPRADASGFSLPPKPSFTGANSTALGSKPPASSNLDEIALDMDDDDDVSAPALTRVRPASLPQRPAAPTGDFVARNHQTSFPIHRHQDPSPSGPWYEGYYDPMSNENPWERIETNRGMSSIGSWLPRGGGATRP